MKESRPLMKVISVGGRERTVGWLRSGALLGLLVPLMNAQAAVIDDVKTTVDTIKTTTNSINTKVTSVKSQTNLIAPIQSKVGDIQNSLQDLPSTIQATIGVNIDPEMKAEILDVIDILRTTLDERKSDLESFGDGSAGTGCYDFRISLKALTRDSIDTMFLLESFGGSSIPEPPADRIEATLALIDVLDCKLLLPAWLALSNSPIGGFAEPLTETRVALSAIMPLFDTASIDLSSAQIQAENSLPSGQGQTVGLTAVIIPSSCEWIDVSDRTRRLRVSSGALGLKITSVTMQILGAHYDPDIFEGGGPIVKPGYKLRKKSVGVHGYAHLELERKSPTAKAKVAKFFKYLGELLGAVADWASGKVDTCIDVENQNRLFENQIVILTEICSLSRFQSETCQPLRPSNE